MGQANCTNCNCGSKVVESLTELNFNKSTKSEIEPKSEAIASIHLQPRSSVQLALHESDQQHRQPGGVVKIQALWRGYRDRKAFIHLLKTKALKGNDSSHYRRRQSTWTREKRSAYTFATGAVYIGEWAGSFRDGQGTQIWPDGTKYEGTWRNDKTHGHGKYYHANGEVYEGSWQYDRINGKGVYSLNREGRLEERSLLKQSAALRTEEGDVMSKSREGRMHMQINGASFEGDWREDLQEGYGVELWVDGSEFRGFYQNGKKQGFGCYSWADGSRYIGNWLDNKICGRGVYTWPDGRRYEGEWNDNAMHGYGEYSWRDGRKYHGEYCCDKKHGQGTYIWSDGRYYKGSWKNGSQHGEGVIVYPDGSQVRGKWLEGKRVNGS
jgi:hypothetical protein